MIPENTSIKMLAFGLSMAHFVYGDVQACILFIVQPGEKNVRFFSVLTISYFQKLDEQFVCKKTKHVFYLYSIF